MSKLSEMVLFLFSEYFQSTFSLSSKDNITLLSFVLYFDQRIIYVQINQIVDEHLKNKYFQPREYRNPYQSFGGYRTGLHILCSILPLWELSSWCKTLPLHETVSLFLSRRALHTFRKACRPRIVNPIRHYYPNSLWLPRPQVLFL